MRPRRAQPHEVLLLQHLVSRIGQLGHDEELQVQVPLSQTRLLPQTWPHAPQLLLSLCSLTQVAPHAL
jgi:hypothetical protein